MSPSVRFALRVGRAQRANYSRVLNRLSYAVNMEAHLANEYGLTRANPSLQAGKLPKLEREVKRPPRSKVQRRRPNQHTCNKESNEWCALSIHEVAERNHCYPRAEA